MPQMATRERVQELLEHGGQVVEVLPRDQYDWAHIAGAIHVALNDLSDEALVERTIERGRPVVLYCNEFQ